jgi:hypothetical protein
MAELGGDRRIESWKAVADIPRYHVVRATGERTCNIASHAAAAFGVGIVGVCENAPSSGQHASLCVNGESKVVAGASYSVNALLTTNGSGRAIAAASGQQVLGRARQAAGADGDVTSVYVDVYRLSGAI